MAVRVVPRPTAVIVAVRVWFVLVVVIVNVADVAPAGIVTDAGTRARVALLLRRVTVVAVAAARLRVTVPVDETPPRTDAGFKVKALNVAGAVLMVNVAVLVTDPAVAVTVAVVAAFTEVVVTVKVAVDAPAATVTVAGTAAAALLLAKLTTIPPVGAGEPSVTVPVTFVPPLTAVGLTAIADNTPAGTEIDLATSVLPATSTVQ